MWKSKSRITKENQEVKGQLEVEGQRGIWTVIEVSKQSDHITSHQVMFQQIPVVVIKFLGIGVAELLDEVIGSIVPSRLESSGVTSFVS